MEQDGKSMAQEESNRGNKEWNPERKDANLDNEASETNKCFAISFAEKSIFSSFFIKKSAIFFSRAVKFS